MELLQDAIVIVLNLAIMAGAGMGVHLGEVRSALFQKRTMALAVAVNFLLLPVAAWLLLRLIPVAPAFATGILLAVTPPGGGTGLLLTRIAGGNLSLAVALLVLFVVFGAAATPAMVYALGSSIDGPVVEKMIANALGFQLVPFAIGLLTQRYAPAVAERLEPWLSKLGLVMLLVLTFGLIALKGTLLFANGVTPLVVMFAVSVIAGASGLVFSGSICDRAAFGLSTSIRNISLAMLLASLCFKEAEVMMAVLSYALIMYVTALPAMVLYRRKIKQWQIADARWQTPAASEVPRRGM